MKYLYLDTTALINAYKGGGTKLLDTYAKAAATDEFVLAITDVVKDELLYPPELSAEDANRLNRWFTAEPNRNKPSEYAKWLREMPKFYDSFYRRTKDLKVWLEKNAKHLETADGRQVANFRQGRNRGYVLGSDRGERSIFQHMSLNPEQAQTSAIFSDDLKFLNRDFHRINLPAGLQAQGFNVSDHALTNPDMLNNALATSTITPDEHAQFQQNLRTRVESLNSGSGRYSQQFDGKFADISDRPLVKQLVRGDVKPWFKTLKVIGKGTMIVGMVLVVADTAAAASEIATYLKENKPQAAARSFLAFVDRMGEGALIGEMGLLGAQIGGLDAAIAAITAIAGGAAEGALVGGEIGTVVPGPGTVAGVLAGALIGAVAGMMLGDLAAKGLHRQIEMLTGAALPKGSELKDTVPPEPTEVIDPRLTAEVARQYEQESVRELQAQLFEQRYATAPVNCVCDWVSDRLKKDELPDSPESIKRIFKTFDPAIKTVFGEVIGHPSSLNRAGPEAEHKDPPSANGFPAVEDDDLQQVPSQHEDRPWPDVPGLGDAPFANSSNTSGEAESQPSIHAAETVSKEHEAEATGASIVGRRLQTPADEAAQRADGDWRERRPRGELRTRGNDDDRRYDDGEDRKNQKEQDWRHSEEPDRRLQTEDDRKRPEREDDRRPEEDDRKRPREDDRMRQDEENRWRRQEEDRKRLEEDDRRRQEEDEHSRQQEDARKRIEEEDRWRQDKDRGRLDENLHQRRAADRSDERSSANRFEPERETNRKEVDYRLEAEKAQAEQEKQPHLEREAQHRDQDVQQRIDQDALRFHQQPEERGALGRRSWDDTDELTVKARLHQAELDGKLAQIERSSGPLHKSSGEASDTYKAEVASDPVTREKGRVPANDDRRRTNDQNWRDEDRKRPEQESRKQREEGEYGKQQEEDGRQRREEESRRQREEEESRKQREEEESRKQREEEESRKQREEEESRKQREEEESRKQREEEESRKQREEEESRKQREEEESRKQREEEESRKQREEEESRKQREEEDSRKQREEEDSRKQHEEEEEENRRRSGGSTSQDEDERKSVSGVIISGNNEQDDERKSVSGVIIKR